MLVAAAFASVARADSFDVLFQQPALDRWMYPFNSSAGSRATMSVFGSDREVPTQFDARDGQILLAFDTAPAIPAGGPASGYRVIGAEMTMQVQNNLVFRLDTTTDAWTTFLPANDPRRTADLDAGQPVELFGVGFRGGFTAATFTEDAAFASGASSFLSPGVRNAFAAVVDGGGTPSDVSNNPRVGFQPKHFAIGSIDGVAPGALVPGDSVMRFQLDVTDPGIQAYLCQGLRDGRVFLAASALTIVQQQAGEYPVFYAKENAFVQFGLAQAPRLRLRVETLPACAAEDLDCSGTVDFGDVALALVDFGPCVGCPADLDGSGQVDYGDVALIMLNYG